MLTLPASLENWALFFRLSDFGGTEPVEVQKRERYYVAEESCRFLIAWENGNDNEVS
jgi:hypothetical protein